MLSSLSKRSPVILRVFLTAMSALSAIVFASAFTLVPSPATGSSQPASPAQPLSNAAAIDLAAFNGHQWHVLHLEHLAHLAWLAQQAAAQHPVQSAPVTVAHTSYQCGDGDGDGYDIPCSQLHDSAPQTVSRATPATSSQAVAPATYHGGSGIQACIIAAESGGDSQIMNGSGHYGLYQFSYSTWTGSGGSGADFGHASVAEQNQVFANAVAARGYSDWTPYDGC
jgi:hypothetical protein